MKYLLVSLLTALTFSACQSFRSNKPVAISAGFDWQGHRGCRGLMPENSIPAFVKALEFEQVTTLELDVAVSKDGKIIVSHEPWFNPAISLMPNGDSIPKKEDEKYLIYTLTEAEIKQYDCGSKGNVRFPQQQKQKTYKPTLSEVVAAVRAKQPNTKINWNIEIKSEPAWDGIRTPPVADFAKMLLEEITALGIEKQTCIQSFDVRALQEVYKLKPNQTMALLIENIQGFDTNIKKLGFRPSIYSPYFKLVNKNLIKKCHAQGIKVIPWTVNDVASMRHLIRLGVDGIITDYPNLITVVQNP
jgi:glycerophosphoryl diester phosphodiesterase